MDDGQKIRGNGKPVPLDEVSVEEAAHLIHRSHWWLRKRIGKKNGPPIRRRGRKIQIPTEEFLEWAKQPKIA
jgi:hypothetical protein